MHNSLNNMQFNAMQTYKEQPPKDTKEMIYSDLPSSVRGNPEDQIIVSHNHIRGPPNRIDIRNIN